jgi:hypothetical protein
VYRESITSGTCDNNGTWKVLVDSSTAISVGYTPPSGRYTVSGRLTR